MTSTGARRPRLRRVAAGVLVSLVLGVAACAASTPARADAREQATCDAVSELGAVVNALLSGKVRAGDPGALRQLAAQAHVVRDEAARTSNPVLDHQAARAEAAAVGIALPPADRPRRPGESPEALVLAYRSLGEECRALGVPVDPDD